MKIIYGITKSNFGGAQRYVFDLASEAKRAGHEVKVVHGKTGALTDKLRTHGIETIAIPGMRRDINLFGEIPAGIQVMKILRREGPDIFHINSSKMGGTGAFAVLLMNLYWLLNGSDHRTKAVFTSHGWAFQENRRAWQKAFIKFFAWLTIILSHETICVSEKTRQEIASWPMIKNKLTVVKNGVGKFELLSHAESRHALGLDPRAIVFGTLAELHHIKGLDTLLRAWAKLKDRREAVLVVMGEGEERERLERLAFELGIDGSVSFKGYIEDARKYLEAFDVFVLPSLSENLPYAILEAGLAGLPVVASCVGGIPEIIEDEESGLLVEPGSPKSLFSRLLLITESEEMRKRLGENLKKRIEREFSIEKMAKETFASYR